MRRRTPGAVGFTASILDTADKPRVMTDDDLAERATLPPIHTSTNVIKVAKWKKKVPQRQLKVLQRELTNFDVAQEQCNAVIDG